ncbi:hypothetical protein EDD18DRAFT_1109160 [Armillaria luteobubalina]|uniref:Uncharacterized protein n=1 Tax=Armillaria luteobubalina TaxID=153913 RepID=A0AA39TK10_9AGAR|nr:hypothetical protein EDD18DRAFT_1109160 [Armillaria luteobubalina]
MSCNLTPANTGVMGQGNSAFEPGHGELIAALEHCSWSGETEIDEGVDLDLRQDDSEKVQTYRKMSQGPLLIRAVVCPLSRHLSAPTHLFQHDDFSAPSNGSMNGIKSSWTTPAQFEFSKSRSPSGHCDLLTWIPPYERLAKHLHVGPGNSLGCKVHERSGSRSGRFAQWINEDHRQMLNPRRLAFPRSTSSFYFTFTDEFTPLPKPLLRYVLQHLHKETPRGPVMWFSWFITSDVGPLYGNSESSHLRTKLAIPPRSTRRLS